MVRPLISTLLLLFCLCATAVAQEKRRAEHVFIISLDQGAPRNIQQSEMPTLKSMVASGAHTWDAFTIVPSLTLPSHTSMLTGVGIQKHQITWNDLQPDKGFVTVPTIFGLAKQRGLTTAMFTGKAKFKTLEVPGTIDLADSPEIPEAKNIAEAFASKVGELKPNLCFIHFPDPDVKGHQYGTDSPEKLQALAECDAAIKRIKDSIAAAGLAEKSVIIVTADHGGHDRPQKENEDRAKAGLPPQPGTHGSADKADVVIPWIVWGVGVKQNYEITAPVITYDTAATALWLLGVPVPTDFWGRPVVSAFQ